MRQSFNHLFAFCLRTFFLTVALILFQQSGFSQQSGNPTTNPSGSSRSSTISNIIRGKIFMPSDTLPERRIRVMLEHSAGGVVSETFSDSVGNFEFRNLSNGTYRVTVPTDGYTYETGQEAVEVFGSFSRTANVQIYLKEKNRGPSVTTKEKLLSPADIQEVPKEAKKAYEQGVKLARESKPDKASAKLQEALQLFPDYLHALNKLGEQMVAMNKLDLAQANFERAIVLNPKFALPYINYGMLMVSQKRYAEAISALETGNALDDTYPVGHLNLGLALMAQNPPDLDRAEKELNRVVAIGKKDFVHIRKLIFNLNVRRQKYDKAVAQLEAYLKEAPEAPDAQDVRLTLDKLKKTMVQQTAAQKQQ